jgi:hypothetical protein
VRVGRIRVVKGPDHVWGDGLGLARDRIVLHINLRVFFDTQGYSPFYERVSIMRKGYSASAMLQ